MQEYSIITQTLAAGAAAVLMPNQVPVQITKQDFHKAYEILKITLRQRYPQVEVDLLDIAPGSIERHRMLENQLQTSGALNDEEVIAKGTTLLAEIFENFPGAATAVGI
jgi:hypothetical protein